MKLYEVRWQSDFSEGTNTMEADTVAVGEDGMLVLRKDDETIAYYADGQWVGVREVTP